MLSVGEVFLHPSLILCICVDLESLFATLSVTSSPLYSLAIHR